MDVWQTLLSILFWILYVLPTNNFLLSEISHGQISVSRKKTELCVCMCVQSPYTDGSYEAPWALHIYWGLHKAPTSFVHREGATYTHTYVHTHILVLFPRHGVLCKTPIQRDFSSPLGHCTCSGDFTKAVGASHRELSKAPQGFTRGFTRELCYRVL